MGEKELIPAIRFKGFTDPWEQRAAAKIFFSASEKGFKDLPVLSATQDRGMILRDNSGINIQYEKSSLTAYKKIEPGDFVIHLRSFQGGFAHSDYEGITSPAYTVLKIWDRSQHDDCFWKHIFISAAFIHMLERATYGVRDGRSVSCSDFFEMRFFSPKKKEQALIAKQLDKFDALIALHQRKLTVRANLLFRWGL